MSGPSERLALLHRDLEAISLKHAEPVFTSSLGAEDMVLAHFIAKAFRAITIVTLDTGRLPAETLDLLPRAEAHLRKRIRVFFPERAAVEQYVQINGINGFRDSVSQREACCAVRKVEPLRRALVGKDAWLTGLRRAQSSARAEVAAATYDTGYAIHKYNPLLEWSDADIWAVIRAESIPYNPLHDQGYPSLGCAPCTRAVAAGEHPRAGRWWWEQADAIKECGLHVNANREPLLPVA
jgi:phosphoadenosine phosphosulfate reductase